MTTIYVPNYAPVKGSIFTFYTFRLSARRISIYSQVNPTLANGDVTVFVDGVSFGNIDTLPVVIASGRKNYIVTLSAAEMTGNKIADTILRCGR